MAEAENTIQELEGLGYGSLEDRIDELEDDRGGNNNPGNPPGPRASGPAG